MGIFRSEILLSFLFSLAGKWVGFFLHAVSFSFIFFLLSSYTEFVVDHPSRQPRSFSVLVGLNSTQNQTVLMQYIYIYEQPSSRAADWKFF
jgi:hypothetical protein